MQLKVVHKAVLEALATVGLAEVLTYAAAYGRRHSIGRLHHRYKTSSSMSTLRRIELQKRKSAHEAPYQEIEKTWITVDATRL